MQLPAQSDAASVPIDSGVGSHHATSGGGKAPAASSTSPSSPDSPSKSAGGATREKPVKVLPCPRCESMNTKFCYYNNYSVTQPRHFCRQCQRYWTAGGTLRNVPVGGGSRKKNRHPRGGEPYVQRGVGGPSPPTPGAGGGISPAPFGLQNVGGHFQQMLSQDGGFTQLNFAQLPGFPPQGYHHPGYPSMDPVEFPPSMQHAMYGTAPPPMQSIPPFYQLPQEGAPQFSNDATAVKSEFWPHPNMVAAPAPASHNPTKRFESSMLLNLGLNSRQGIQQKHPAWEQQSQAQPESQQQAQAQTDVKASTTKNGSPPHGSSTIEEEGSTPTNGYSNNGYEEADAVSSMWHNLSHDMENIFSQ